MVRVFGSSVIGLAALVTTGLLAAQDPFAEGVNYYRLGETDKALQKFEEALAADPSNEQAFEIWKRTDAAVWHALAIEGGELGKIAEHMLALAQVGRKQMSRDEATIAGLVDQATSSSDYGERRAATVQLVADHGAFAVPALVQKLGNPDDDQSQIYAILALQNIGRPATLPLIQALKSDNELVRRNAAAAIGQIKDERAAPAMALLASRDPKEAVRDTATHVLASLGVPATANPVNLYLADGNAYLADSGVRSVGELSDVVWTFSDGALVAQDVSPSIYNFELAKRHGHDALSLEPTNDDAKVLIARAYLGQVAATEETAAASGEGASAQLPALKMAAAATGVDSVRRAVSASINAGMAPMAVAGIELLGNLENGDDLVNSPLISALGSNQPRVSYAAALALTKAAGGRQLPAADKVVRTLAAAVSEESIRRITIVDRSPITERAVQAANFTRGIQPSVQDSAAGVMNDLYLYPDVDVVVLSETLPDGRPEAVVGLIRKDPRMANMKILVLANDPDAAAERFGDRIDGTIQGPLSGDSLKAAVEAALDGVEVDAKRARATTVAVAASNALDELATNNVDISSALENLTEQLTREDAVAVPAAKAIGEGGNEGNVAALIATLQGDAASADLRLACADATGEIFARSGALSNETFEPLFAMLGAETDPALRAAIVNALGKAHLDAAAKLKLINAMTVVPSRGMDG